MDFSKDIYDKESIIKDVRERKEIIDKYQSTHVLDRKSAIEKIMKLRMTDEQVAVETTARLMVSSVPFEHVSDGGIVSELKMQMDILLSKLA